MKYRRRPENSWPGSVLFYILCVQDVELTSVDLFVGKSLHLLSDLAGANKIFLTIKLWRTSRHVILVHVQNEVEMTPG